MASIVSDVSKDSRYKAKTKYPTVKVKIRPHFFKANAKPSSQGQGKGLKSKGQGHIISTHGQSQGPNSQGQCQGPNSQGHAHKEIEDKDENKDLPQRYKQSNTNEC